MDWLNSGIAALRGALDAGQVTAEALVEGMAEIFAASGLETRLGALGITEADIPGMAEEVTVGITRLLVNNPRDMNFDDVAGLYHEIL